MVKTTINPETHTVRFDSGKELKEQGIKQAIDHAEEVIPTWGEQAYKFFYNYAEKNRVFMTEDVRMASEGIIEEPPSKRAWGAIVRKAKKNNIIEFSGFGKVSNPKAHQATASAWQSKIYKHY